MLNSWQEFLSKRTPTVRARIERLNPKGPKEGEKIRGYYPKRWQGPNELDMAIVPKRKFIKQFGREEWNKIPSNKKYKYGRREFVPQMYLTREGL